MNPRRWPIRFPAHPENAPTENKTTVKELECAAQLLEDLIPRAKSELERKLCRDVVQGYRAAASRLLRGGTR
jgi:hypothetical protein